VIGQSKIIDQSRNRHRHIDNRRAIVTSGIARHADALPGQMHDATLLSDTQFGRYR